MAPEHLELALEDSEELARQINNAGAIFLGRYTPEAIGDYVAGPNHVLPTGRSARFSSGLGVLDFLKRSTFVAGSSVGLAAVGPAAVTSRQSGGTGGTRAIRRDPVELAAGALVTGAATAGGQRIAKVFLEEPARIRLSPQVEHERRSALFDLLQTNHFAPVGDYQGPYILHLGVDGERLIFDVRSEADAPLTQFTLPLFSLRKIIKDYFLVLDSYFKAIKNMPPSRIEAIDMGRRGLHNEGAEVLRKNLAARVELDKDTARRLFTLICVLQIRG